MDNSVKRAMYIRDIIEIHYAKSIQKDNIYYNIHDYKKRTYQYKMTLYIIIRKKWHQITEKD